MEPRRQSQRGESSRSNGRDSTMQEQGEEQGDPDERRYVRVGYRNLQNSLHEEVDPKGLVESNFQGLIGEIENLHTKVSKPREQVADAEILLHITSTLLDSVKSVHRVGKITPGQFVDTLLAKFPGGERILDWAAFGTHVGCLLPEAPGLSTMLGPMDIQPKAKKVAERKKAQKTTAEVSRPEEMKDTSEEQANQEVEKNMLEMFTILRTKKLVKLEHLLLNRLSFAQTVENLFALSFLAKDGRVEIKVGEGGGIVVVPKNAPTADRRKTENIVNRQFVFRFDYADWKFMQEQVVPGDELMRHRVHNGKDQPCATKKRAAPDKDASKSSKRQRKDVEPPEGAGNEEQAPVDEGVVPARKTRRGNSNRVREDEVTRAQEQVDEEAGETSRRKPGNDPQDGNAEVTRRISRTKATVTSSQAADELVTPSRNKQTRRVLRSSVQKAGNVVASSQEEQVYTGRSVLIDEPEEVVIPSGKTRGTGNRILEGGNAEVSRKVLRSSSRKAAENATQDCEEEQVQTMTPASRRNRVTRVLRSSAREEPEQVSDEEANETATPVARKREKIRSTRVLRSSARNTQQESTQVEDSEDEQVENEQESTQVVESTQVEDTDDEQVEEELEEPEPRMRSRRRGAVVEELEPTPRRRRRNV